MHMAAFAQHAGLVAAQLATAVAHLHSAGLVHLNLRPENVLLCVDCGAGSLKPSVKVKVRHMSFHIACHADG